MLAHESAPLIEQIGVPFGVALIGLIATIASAAISFALSRWSDTSTRRREGYSSATEELVAWAEYPYRIRRRTTDDPAELARLANLGHDLQEALRYRQTWVTAEDVWLARVFQEVRDDLAVALRPACADAWKSAPISRASEMNLNGWGPVGANRHLERFERAVRFRFGWRRLVGVFGWHPGAEPRPAGVSS
jgi:hypothetical protein